MEKLIIYATTYQHLYKQPIYGIFHTACGCIVGQQVAFNIGRNIRKQLYEICGYPLTRDKVLKADLSSIKYLTPERKSLLLKLANIDDVRPISDVLNDYSALKGFGPWTYGAVSILTGISNTINLYTDSYIRKNLCIYTNSKMTIKNCNNYITNAGENQTGICYLLWIIKPNSVEKIRQGAILTTSDFV